MKKSLILFLFIGLTSSVIGQSIDSLQVKDTGSNGSFALSGQALRFQVSNLFKRSIQFDYEVPTSPVSSIVFSPSGTMYESGDKKVFGGGMVLAHRKYSHLNLSQSSKKDGGLYISLKAGYNYLNINSTRFPSDYNPQVFSSNVEREQVTDHIHQFFFGGGVGVQFIFKGSISIDTSIGSALKYSVGGDEQTKNEMEQLNIIYAGFAPFMRVGIGIVNSK